MKKIVYSLLGNANVILNKVKYSLQKTDEDIVVFNTAIGTDNLGDCIIMKYCYEYLKSTFPEKNFREISTHIVPNGEETGVVKRKKYKFVCGTNLLTSHIEEWWNWRLPEGYRGKQDFRNVILVGAGWGVYQDKCSMYSQMIYKTMLNPCVIHSVRDEYTENKLKEIGIKNVINTGCPTMWRLTPEFCKRIPIEKAENVVTTITDYRRDIKNDNLMLEILSRNYRKVYLWIQGKKDQEYLETLTCPENLVIISRDLDAYEKILKQGNIDFVGTRLHAGIFALNHGVRSLIIAVDNRAIEIAKDTNLPIIHREKVEEELQNTILSKNPTNIIINEANIEKFKSQFRDN